MYQKSRKTQKDPPLEVKLDLKDKRLLFELDFHARSTFSHLAKNIGLSKQGVEYKMNSLVKKGVVKGFYPVINVPKLGYLYCRLLLTLRCAPREKHDEMTNFLFHHHKVFWLFQMHGAYDLLLVIWARNVSEFTQFIRELDQRFGEHIKHKVETIATDVIHYQHRYLLRTTKTDVLHLKETEMRTTIDEIDKKILTSLCNDARATLVQIALEVKESAKVVSYRIRRMEREGLIEGYRPIIDHNIIGYTYYKLFINCTKVSQKELLRLKTYLVNSSLLLYLVEGIGLPADLDIELMVRTNQELFAFIEDLRFRFSTLIGDYETVVFMDTLKVRYLPW